MDFEILFDKYCKNESIYRSKNRKKELLRFYEYLVSSSQTLLEKKAPRIDHDKEDEIIDLDQEEKSVDIIDLDTVDIEEQKKLFEQTIENDHIINDEISECSICFEPLNMNNLYPLESCEHIFCIECIPQYINSQLKDMNIRMKCPDLDCTSYLQYHEIYQFLEDPEEYNKLSLKVAFQEMSDVAHCPQPNCQYSQIKEHGTDYIRCHTCRFEYCFACQYPWHEGISCEDFERVFNEHKKEETESNKWKLKRTKPCPKCNVRIQKNKGCSHMTCRHCRYEFCWLCLKNWKAMGGYGAHSATHCRQLRQNNKNIS